MPITMIDSTGPMVGAKVSGELSKSDVSQMQAAALEAIRRCGKISACSFSRISVAGSGKANGAISAS